MTHRAYRHATGAAIFFVLLSGSAVQAFAATTAPAYRGPAVVLPARIEITSARVDAPVVGVGVTREGDLDVPHNFVQAGWYRFGSIPGQNGNAVIDGHVDNAGSIPGPFKHLVGAKVGDDVTVVMNDGSKAVYTIVSSIIYPVWAFPAKSVFIGDATTSVLKLITCNGTFVRSMGTYDHRLIVTAVKKSQLAAYLARRPARSFIRERIV